jgi:large subunit ribosomal protein L24
VAIARIKKGDEVIAIAGVNSGKRGKVLSVDPVKQRAVVEGLNIVKKAVRASEANPQGGIIEVEAGIALSNLMPYDPEAKKGVRVSRSRDGERPVRKSKKTTHVFD